MMKRLSVITALFFFVCAPLAADKADEKNLLNMVPAAPEVVVSADTTGLFEMAPLKKGLAESRDLADFTGKTGLKIDDLSAVLFWMKGSDFAVLTAWKKPFDPSKIFTAPHFSCVRRKISGIDLYSISVVKAPREIKKVSRIAGKRALSYWIALLPGNRAAFFSSSAAAVRALKLMKGKRGFKFPKNLTGTLRGIARGEKLLPFRQISLSCAMTGAKKEDFSCFLSGTLSTAQEAAAMRNQAMLMCNLILMQTFQKKPEMVGELLNCIKFDVSGNVVLVKTVIPGKLLSALGQEAAAQAKERKAAKKRRKSPAPKRTGAAAQ